MADIVYWIGRSPDPKRAIITFWDRAKALKEWERVKNHNLDRRKPLRVFAAYLLYPRAEITPGS
jgi:hypothetical protein